MGGFSFYLLGVAAFSSSLADDVDVVVPKDDGYMPVGDDIMLDDLPVYVSPPGVPLEEGDEVLAVVWGHDIAGPTSGRTYELVDRLAADTKYTVLLPDFFRGAMYPPPDTYKWDTVTKYDWEDKLRPYLEDEVGADAVGIVGTCWGSYLAVHASTDADSYVRAGFSPHPSHPGMMAVFGEDEEAQYELINAASSAQYFFPTPSDSDHCKEGGLADSTLDVVFIHETEEPCTHGYFHGGDLDDPAVEECVEFTYSEMIDFLDEYLALQQQGGGGGGSGASSPAMQQVALIALFLTSFAKLF